MEETGWVSVEDEEPEEMETVLVATAWGSVALGAMYEGGWEVEFAPWDSPPDGDEVEVTYWRPLPLPPA